MKASASVRVFDRLVPPVAAVGTIVVALRLLDRIADAPQYLFNAARVATSIAFVRGYRILTGPDEGPVIDFMYGPVSAAAYAPAALSPTPTGAVWLGTALSFAFVVVPFACLALAGPERSSRLAILGIAVFGIWCGYDGALAMAAFDIHADAPSIGLAMGACACVLASDRAPTDRALGLAALLAVLAVWTKQTAAPIVVALPACVWLRDGRRCALRCLLWTGGVGLAVSTGFVLTYGLERIVFTMFEIPGGHPWPSGSAWKSLHGRDAAVYASLGRLARVAAPSAALVLAVAAAAIWRDPSGQRVALRRAPWVSVALVGLWMVPISALGGAKLGGDANSYALTTYFWAAAGVLGLVELADRGPAVRRALAQGTLVAVVLFAALDGVREENRERLVRSVSELSAWRSNLLEQSTAFALRHPEQVLALANPLIGLYSDGLLYNSTLGIGDRLYAGIEVSDELRRRHVPARLRFLLQRREAIFGKTHRPKRDYPAFAMEMTAESLPGYRVWVRGKPRTPSG